MKHISWLLILIVASFLALPTLAAETDRLKSDLVGQTMGGREKAWKFQSIDQIKELVIKNKTEDAQKQVYNIALKLQATNDSAKYSAEARVEYTNAISGWRIKHVGLLSLKKVE